MTDSPQEGQSVETSIALLGLQVKSQGVEINAKLDGLKALMDSRLSAVERDQADLDKRMTAQETKAYKFEGAKLVLYGMFGALSGLATFALTWLSQIIKLK